MVLKKIEHNLTVCKVRDISDIDMKAENFDRALKALSDEGYTIV